MVHLLEQEGSRDPATPSRMCPEELVYAKEFADSLDAHLHSLVLKDMPSNFMKIDRKKASECAVVRIAHVSTFQAQPLERSILLHISAHNNY